MKKLRAGVIGLGMGQWHAGQWSSDPGSQLVAIADQDKNRLKQVSEKHKVSACYTNAFEMLRKESLDVVSVATPNKFHAPLAIAASRAGCHVLCEKPMAMNAREARAMIAAAKKAKKRLMINFSFRFTPASWALKKELDAGVLGNVYFGRTVWMRRRGMPGFGGWFGQKALSGGGPLIDLGVHRLDLALWLMGYPKPTWVMGSTYNHLGLAKARKEKKKFDVEDLAVALIKFDTGASLELAASWAANIKEGELMETRILGTKAGIAQRNLNEGYDFESEIYLEKNGYQYDIKPRWINDCPTSVRHFADSIVHNRPHMASGEEGLVVMQILDAVYKSARTGKPVRVD